MNKKLAKLKESRKEGINIQMKLLKEKMLKQVEDSFKSLESRFEDTFDEKVESLLLRDYRDSVDQFEENQSRHFLSSLRDKYRKLIFTPRKEGSLGLKINSSRY